MRWAQWRPDWEQLTTVNAVATPPRTDTAPPAAGTASARRNEARMGGGGLRLGDAFGVVSSLPLLLEARVRLLTLAYSPANSSADLAEAIESDCGLTIAVMRAANNGAGAPGGGGRVRGG